MNVDDMTEDQALDVLQAFERRFGWVGIMLVRADADSIVTTYDFDAPALTDEQWERLSTSSEWLDAYGVLSEYAFDLALDAVRSFMLDEKENQ
jgi:hypothetical protein